MVRRADSVVTVLLPAATDVDRTTSTAAWYALSMYATPPSHSTPASPLHDMHCSLPASREYVLRGHASHVPLLEKWPSGHGLHTTRCFSSLAAALPAGHVTQAGCPVALLYGPAGQYWHDAEPSLPLYCPTGHSLHAVVPSTLDSAYVPRAHCTHCPCPSRSLYCPGGHGSWRGVMLFSVQMKPAWHGPEQCASISPMRSP